MTSAFSTSDSGPGCDASRGLQSGSAFTLRLNCMKAFLPGYSYRQRILLAGTWLDLGGEEIRERFGTVVGHNVVVVLFEPFLEGSQCAGLGRDDLVAVSWERHSGKVYRNLVRKVRKPDHRFCRLNVRRGSKPIQQKSVGRGDATMGKGNHSQKNDKKNKKPKQDKTKPTAKK